MRKSFSLIYLLLLGAMQASSLMDHLKHNDQLQLQREFRQNHDLSIFQKPRPVIQISDPNKKNVQLSTVSAFRLWNNDPIQSFSLHAAGQWDKLSLLIEPVIVNEPYGHDLLGGTDYVRYGISGRITSAFIRYNNELISLQLGRSPVWWGQSWNHSIIQTGSTPADRKSVV